MSRHQGLGAVLVNILMLIFLIASLTLSYGEELTSPPISETTYGIVVNPLGRNYVDHQSALNLINDLRRAGFNFFIPQVRENCTLYYTSAIETRSPKIAPDYLDPLQDMITLANFPSLIGEPIIDVYPGIEVLKVHDKKTEALPAADSLVKKRPEWLSLTLAGEQTDLSGISIVDPALPQVQVYLEELIKELVRKYEIKRILFDSLYYPGSSWGYNPEAIKLFKQETGSQETPSADNPSWSNWRREKLTQLLRRLSAAVKQEKSDVKVIVAVEVKGQPPKDKEDFKRSEPYIDNLQDWVNWAEAEIVDCICLKNYWREFADADKFNGWLDFAKTLKGKTTIWVGIAGSVNFTDDIVEQMRRARVIAPQAMILDNYRQPSRDNRALLFSTLKRTVFARKELAIPRFVVEAATPSPTAIPTSPTLMVLTPAPELTTPTLAVLPPIISPLPTTPEMPEETTPTMAVSLTPAPPPEPSPITTPAGLLPLLATPVEWDTIYLTNGNIIKGKVVDRIEHLVIVETEDGLKLNLNAADIEKIVPPPE